MVTGFVMILAQMQTQATNLDVVLTITSNIGSLERSASFRDGTWHGNELTHGLIDSRAHLLGLPWIRSVPLGCFLQPCNHCLTYNPPRMASCLHQFPRNTRETPRFSCTLPRVPPQTLTPLMPLACSGIRLLVQPSSTFMVASTFHGGGLQTSEAHDNQREEVSKNLLYANQPMQTTQDNRPSRMVTFQDSYDALTPSTSKDETFRGDPNHKNHLIGFQALPQLQERQRQ